MRAERRWRPVLAAVLAVAATAAAAARSPAPSLSVAVPPKKLTVGDRLAVRVTAHGKPGLLWGTPEVVAGPQAWWAVVGTPEPVADADPPAWNLTLVPLAVGSLPLPPIRVTVRTPGGAGRAVTAEGAPRVTVVSVLPPGGKVKPAPLADPQGVTGFPWEWIPPLLLALLPLVLAGLGLWWWRRRRRRREEGEAADLPPLAALLAAIARLDERVGRAPDAAVCDGLAAELRRYLKRRTGRPAAEMTSFELIRLARREAWPRGVQAAVQEALGLADAVRFARRETAAAALRAALQRTAGAAQELDAHLARLEAAAAEAREGAA